MTLLVFGDSITQGFFDEERGGWVSRLFSFENKKRIDSDHEKQLNIFNLGISGDCTNRLLVRFGNEAQTRLRGDKKDGVILFAIGVNDTQRYVKTNEPKTSRRQFQENIHSLYTTAEKYADTIIFTGILPIIESVVQPMPWANDRSHYTKDIITYDQIIQGFCHEKGCTFIPMQEVFKNMPDFLIDGIHPNAEGHRLIFERVKSELEKLGIL